mgnify:CR=1 FL=1|jgi:hypothetical protein|tara:strand:+ start:506 stop:667 length:162 start_codon:yes stop_codon:yes gene_type:complete
MPFKSEKQRKYLWAKEPAIAKKWTAEHGSKIVKNKGGVIKGIGLRSRWIKEEK